MKNLLALILLFVVVGFSSCVTAQKEQSVTEQADQEQVKNSADESAPKISYIIIEKRLVRSDSNKKIYVYTVGPKVVAEETCDMQGNVVKLEGEIPSGTVRQYNLNNEIISEKYYDASRVAQEKKSYEDRTYFDNGALASIKTYTEGVLDGPLTEFYEDGNKKIQANYKNGVLDGDYTKYGESGKIELFCQYLDGHLNGQYKEYFENGNVKKEQEYLNDKKEGECNEYFETGILKQKYNYAQDVLEGEVEIYYEDGSIKKTEKYKNNKLNGDVKIYSNNNSSNPIYIDNYVNGKKVSRTAYSNNGKKLFKETYDMY